MPPTPSRDIMGSCLWTRSPSLPTGTRSCTLWGRDRLRIVDMRRPAHESNLVQEIIDGEGFMAEVRTGYSTLETSLSASHAAVYPFERPVVVWDRGTGQRVHSNARLCAFGFLKGSLLVSLCEDSTLDLYDLRRPGLDPPIRTYASFGQWVYCHVHGNYLMWLGMGDFYKLNVVDINTGEALGEHHFPHLQGPGSDTDVLFEYAHFSDDVLCVFTPSTADKLERARSVFEGTDLICLNMRTGAVTYTHADYPHSLGDVLHVPDRRHNRLVSWRGRRSSEGIAVLEFN